MNYTARDCIIEEQGLVAFTDKLVSRHVRKLRLDPDSREDLKHEARVVMVRAVELYLANPTGPSIKERVAMNVFSRLQFLVGRHIRECSFYGPLEDGRAVADSTLLSWEPKDNVNTQRDEDRDLLGRARQRFPPKLLGVLEEHLTRVQYELVLLRFGLDMSQVDIARLTHRSEAAVSKSLNAAEAALRRAFPAGLQNNFAGRLSFRK